MTFGLHPSLALQQLYMNRYWQGQDPEKATIMILSIDANWDFDIEQKNPAFFEMIKEYLQDGVAFWKKAGIHHPFLLPEYGRGDGWRFHRNFAELGLDASYAECVSFVELLDVPTFGMSTAKENRAAFNSLINAVYLELKYRDGQPESIKGERFINLHNEKDQYVFVCNHFCATN